MRWRVRSVLFSAILMAAALVVPAGPQDLGTSDGAVDYFNASPHNPTDIFSLGPTGSSGQDSFSSNRGQPNCIEGARVVFRAGIPYSLIQDATRKSFYGYQPVGAIQGYLWQGGPGGVRSLIGNFPIGPYGIPHPPLGQGPPGGIAGDDKPPTETRVLCLLSQGNGYPCSLCIGFPAKRVPYKVGRSLTSDDPCTQCNDTYDHQIDACRANIPVSTSDQYNKCIFDANQQHQACVARSCPSRTGCLDLAQIVLDFDRGASDFFTLNISRQLRERFYQDSGAILNQQSAEFGGVASVFIPVPGPQKVKALVSLAEFARESQISVEVANAIRAAANQVWQASPLIRGQVIEKVLAVTEYATKGFDWVGVRNGGFFRQIDFYNAQLRQLVSLKTVFRTTDASWNQSINTLQRHIQDLADFNKRWHIASPCSEPLKTILDIRVPAGYEQKLQSLVAFGKQYGIDVRISAF